MMTPDSHFVWFLHQPSASGWLKRELAKRRPDLRFAFSRPGLTTFKVEAARADEPASESSFARAWGRSLGRGKTTSEVLAVAAQLGPSLRLHVVERDLDKPADERDAKLAGSRARAFEATLREAAPTQFLIGNEAAIGDRVLDVIGAPAELADDGWFIGWHVHDALRGPFPGGVTHASIPAHAPSRAWAKIEESIRWSGLAPKAGEHAVEIGSAPGGMSLALLNRGLNVIGIDPGVMDPAVLNYRGMNGNRYTHHTMPAAEVQAKDLPRQYEWLVSDVNLAPMIALKYIERFVALAHGGLRGAFITLKLHDDGLFLALPQLRERIAKLGAKGVRYTQLPAHRSEIVALLSW